MTLHDQFGERERNIHRKQEQLEKAALSMNVKAHMELNRATRCDVMCANGSRFGSCEMGRAEHSFKSQFHVLI